MYPAMPNCLFVCLLYVGLFDFSVYQVDASFTLLVVMHSAQVQFTLKETIGHKEALSQASWVSAGRCSIMWCKPLQSTIMSHIGWLVIANNTATPPPTLASSCFSSACSHYLSIGHLNMEVQKLLAATGMNNWCVIALQDWWQRALWRLIGFRSELLKDVVFL